MVIMASFWKAIACGQVVLPDRSILRGQKLVEKAGQKLVKYTKSQKFKCDILSDFQTICARTQNSLGNLYKQNCLGFESYFWNFCCGDHCHPNLQFSSVTMAFFTVMTYFYCTVSINQYFLAIESSNVTNTKILTILQY